MCFCNNKLLKISTKQKSNHKQPFPDENKKTTTTTNNTSQPKCTQLTHKNRHTFFYYAWEYNGLFIEKRQNDATIYKLVVLKIWKLVESDYFDAFILTSSKVDTEKYQTKNRHPYHETNTNKNN